LDILDGCDALLRMPGESSGADAEIAHANANGIPVLFDESSLAEWVNQWKEQHAPSTK
jgi:ABC-type sugar transport system substrate-binding protein